eukprot:3772745-Prymnesium_polylepis.1
MLSSSNGCELAIVTCGSRLGTGSEPMVLTWYNVLQYLNGRWPMVRRKVLGRYAAVRCLWHEVRDDERSNR